MIVCQTCGYQNEDDDTFCGGCPAYLPHTGVHVDDDAPEEVAEAVAAPAEGGGLISRVKGMVGMDDDRDVPGDVLVDEAAEQQAREAEAREAEAREAEVRARQEADAAAAEAERAAAEAQQRREAERAAREEAAERARLEQQAREEAEAAAKARADADTKAREAAQAQARAAAEERERQAAAERAEADERARAAREAEAKAQAEKEARERAEAEAAAAEEAEERERAEAEAQARREAEAAARAEAEARAKAEQEAAERAAAAAAERAEAQRKAEEDERRRAEEEAAAQRKAEEEARERAEAEQQARAEAETRAKAEREAAEAAEREAAEAAERARRAAAMVAKPPPAPPARPTRRQASPVAAVATAGVATAGAAPGAVSGLEAGTATGTGPKALKPTEQRPTAPPPRPPTKKTPPTRKPEPGDQICGQCGEPNRPERKFCRRCANALADAVVVKRPFWQRIIPRRKPKTVAAGDRPGRSASGARKQPIGRRIAKLGRASLRWIIAGMLILGVLGALGLAGPWSDTIQSRLDGAYSAVMNRIRPSYEPANPVEAVASAQARGAGARRVIDGFDNTHWAAGVAVTERPTLTLSWAEPVDIAQVGFLAGGSGDDFRALARPREVRLVFSDGSRSDLTLKDTPDFQTFKVSATQARDVRVLVRSVFPAPDSDAVAITELEFFTRR